MTKLKFSVLSFLAGIILSTNAEAQIQLGKPQINGPGCPRGSVQAIVSPDGSSISVLFDNFMVEGRKGMNPLENVNKYCRFFIPTQLPFGHILEIEAIDYRGFANIAGLNQATITTTGPSITATSPDGATQARTVLKKRVGNFFVSQKLTSSNTADCMIARNLDFTTSLQLAGPMGEGLTHFLSEDSEVMIDSLDIGPRDAIRLRIRMKRCM